MDADSDLPVAVAVASANENEKKHAGELADKASLVVEGFEIVVADSQYSSRRVRGCVLECGAESVIPYPSNQRRGEPVLRVDRFFRTSGSAVERRIYGLGRASVERVNSRLESVGLGCLKLRGLRNVMVHVLLCIIVMLLVAVAAHRLGRPWKARSLASFWWELTYTCNIATSWRAAPPLTSHLIKYLKINVKIHLFYIPNYVWDN